MKKIPNFRKGSLAPIVFGSLVLFLLGLGIWIGSAYLVWVTEESRIAKTLEKYQREISSLESEFLPKPIKIRDRSGNLIGEFYRRNFKPIRLDNLNNHSTLIWALLSSEDREFYVHSGINYFAIGRAILTNLSQFRFSQGGSTITQQLAKLTLNLGKRNISNKLTELYCTFYLETHFTKDEILTMYLNQIFLGEGNTGIEEASRYYFRKPAQEITPEEAALLIGIIPAPSVYNPMRNLGISLQRQKRVLLDMSEHTDLNPRKNFKKEKFQKSIDSNLKKFYLHYKIIERKKGETKEYESEIGKYGSNKDFRINLAPDFNQDVRNFVLDNFTEEELEESGIEIYTTLDLEKQKVAEQVLRQGIDEVRKEISKGNWNNPEHKELAIARMTGAFVALDPLTGNIEALVGGYRYSSVYQINRAEESKRQPGSTIKALVYALAFERKLINPSSKVKDEKLDISGYSPKNWYKGYRGEMTARQALAQSVNTVSVSLLHQMGVNLFRSKLTQILSLTEEIAKERFPDNLSLALGSGELTPMELAIVYSTIANGGRKIRPKKILSIQDETGNEIFSDKEIILGEEIIDPVACAMAVNTLESVLSEEGTMNIKWKQGEKPLYAGKTGTVQSPKSASKKWSGALGVRDTWFAGILPRHVNVVWIGHDQAVPFPGTGAGTTGSVWVQYTKIINQKFGFGKELVQPFVGDFVKVNTCADDGSLLEEDPNFYCKIPLFDQYYYIGHIPPKRDGALLESKDAPEPGEDSEIKQLEVEGIVPKSEGVELEPPSYAED